jgi:hypothetical protein
MAVNTSYQQAEKDLVEFMGIQARPSAKIKYLSSEKS